MSEFDKMNVLGNRDFEAFLRSQPLGAPDHVRDTILFQCGVARGTQQQQRAAAVHRWRTLGLLVAAFAVGGWYGTYISTARVRGGLPIAEQADSPPPRVANQLPSALDVAEHYSRIEPDGSKPGVVVVAPRPGSLYAGRVDIELDREPALSAPLTNPGGAQPPAEPLRAGQGRSMREFL